MAESLPLWRQDGFRKLDLHVHTPYSRCFDYELRRVASTQEILEQMVDSALAIGLEALAITDHNTFQGIEGIQAIVRNRGLLIFPGVELTTPGGHVLGLFSPDASLEALKALLSAVGLAPEAQGDGVAQTEAGIEEVLGRITEWGGLAIAAHVEREPHGFLCERGHEEKRRRIHESENLSALEITVPGHKALWNLGQMPGYPKACACVQGSDAHAPQEIGRRPVYLKLELLSLEGIRLAFRDYPSRIRFPQELSRDTL